MLRYHPMVRYAEEFRPWHEVPAETGSIISVPIYLPRSVALQARREVYPYRFPRQVQLDRRVLRSVLRPTRGPKVLTRVRIRLPRRLPLVRPSYVSIAGGRVNVHSRRQLKRLLSVGEYNRRRYQEFKTNRRKARHGQLDSAGAGFLGIVHEAVQRGQSIAGIADAAMAARALGGWR